jgi:hypothetical protein
LTPDIRGAVKSLKEKHRRKKRKKKKKKKEEKFIFSAWQTVHVVESSPESHRPPPVEALFHAANDG